ncbi:MAG: sigma-70 family RNA polymerase sigma factor [Chthoniobacteraceae bacterium]
MANATSSTPRDHIFATTRWTQVLAAQGTSTKAGTALADLCAAYYAPVHGYIARTAHDLGDPRDLTHGFFARLLAGAMLSGADRELGRFRAYLLGAVKHFLADTRERLLAAKRGARHEHTPLDAGTDTSPGVDFPAPESPTPDVWFDRQWGLAVLSQALDALAAEHEQKGKAAHFTALKPWLTSDAPMLTQASAASQLGMTEGALKVAIHRLRLRFRELVKERIAETVSSEDEMRDELRYLIEVAS